MYGLYVSAGLRDKGTRTAVMYVEPILYGHDDLPRFLAAVSMPCVSALYVCLICMPYLYVEPLLYGAEMTSLIYMYALYVRPICMPYCMSSPPCAAPR
jgi:hypothetical protein